LAGVDIAEMNLLCATGLPGAENLDVKHCLAVLDQWASRVAAETNRHLYRLNDPKWAGAYRHSEPFLRSSMLLQVLQEDLSVKYDLEAKNEFSFKDSRVAFIHGMIPGPGQAIADVPGGTCASMPVMYTAIGRRLGYPLKLVLTRGHIFVRWDGLDHSNPAWRERFNIEGAGQGFGSFEDDYYKTWPYKLTDDEVRIQGYLLSLSPAEELAECLASRGHCKMDNGNLPFAARCFENACGYDPTRPSYRVWFLDAAARCGYQPVIPTLIALLERQKQEAGLARIERRTEAEQAAAWREWLRGSSGALPPGMAPLPPAGVPQPPPVALPPVVPQPYPPTPRRPPEP
jgi:hypothetical protein